MMEFVMMMLASALGYLLAMVVACVVMWQPKVMGWLVNKYMQKSMEYVDKIINEEDKDL